MSQFGIITNEMTETLGRLGFTTNEIATVVGNGTDLDLSQLGIITNEMTETLGADPLPTAPGLGGDWRLFWLVAALGSAVMSGYHGYYRSGRRGGPAAGWALLGLLFPVITPAFALTQGFAQPA